MNLFYLRDYSSREFLHARCRYTRLTMVFPIRALPKLAEFVIETIRASKYLSVGLDGEELAFKGTITRGNSAGFRKSFSKK